MELWRCSLWFDSFSMLPKMEKIAKLSHETASWVQGNHVYHIQRRGCRSNIVNCRGFTISVENLDPGGACPAECPLTLFGGCGSALAANDRDPPLLQVGAAKRRAV